MFFATASTNAKIRLLVKVVTKTLEIVHVIQVLISSFFTRLFLIMTNIRFVVNGLLLLRCPFSLLAICIRFRCLRFFRCPFSPLSICIRFCCLRCFRSLSLLSLLVCFRFRSFGLPFGLPFSLLVCFRFRFRCFRSFSLLICFRFRCFRSFSLLICFRFC